MKMYTCIYYKHMNKNKLKNQKIVEFKFKFTEPELLACSVCALKIKSKDAIGWSNDPAPGYIFKENAVSISTFVLIAELLIRAEMWN